MHAVRALAHAACSVVPALSAWASFAQEQPYPPARDPEHEIAGRGPRVQAAGRPYRGTGRRRDGPLRSSHGGSSDKGSR